MNNIQANVKLKVEVKTTGERIRIGLSNCNGTEGTERKERNDKNQKSSRSFIHGK